MKPIAKPALIYTLILIVLVPVPIMFCEAYECRHVGMILSGAILTLLSLFMLKKLKDNRVTFLMFSTLSLDEKKFFIIALVTTLFGVGIMLMGIVFYRVAA